MSWRCGPDARVLARPALVAFAVLVPGVCLAQTGGPYDLAWSTIDGGGATAVTGGVYSLGGTAGQPDAGVSTGGVYSLQGGFWDSGLQLSAVDEGDLPDPGTVPFVNRLHDVAPNPFNPRTRIAFDLARPGPVRVAVYDVRGARVRILADEPLSPGHHVLTWDGTDDNGAAMASGAYVVTVDAGDFQARRKTILLK